MTSYSAFFLISETFQNKILIYLKNNGILFLWCFQTFTFLP